MVGDLGSVSAETVFVEFATRSESALARLGIFEVVLVAGTINRENS